MKKKLFIITFLLVYINFYSQAKDTLYLYGKNVNIFQKEDKELGFIFIKKSEDCKFKFDSFKFYIPNFKNFKDRYDLIELLIIKNKIDFNENKITSISSLTNKSGWDLHIFLSEFKTIYLVYDNEMESQKYNLIRIFYEGTQKDLIPPPKGKL